MWLEYFCYICTVAIYGTKKTDLNNCGHINLNYLFDAHFQ